MPKPKSKKSGGRKRGAAQRRVPRRRRRRGGFLVSWFKVGLATIVVWGMVGAGYYLWALTFDLEGIHDMSERSVVLDHRGDYYTRLAGENRDVVPFDKVSNDFINALICREDTRFYSHVGIDPIGVARAVVRNLMLGGFREGASTITQQLARNSFTLGGKTLHRKFIEAALAFRIETELSKEEILEAYVNRIYFGSGTYGVESASRVYFGKSASRLNLQESATLAGLIRSPNTFSPLRNPEGSIRERNTVLRRMHDLGMISLRDCEEAAASPLVAMPSRKTGAEFNWAMDAILRELELVLGPGMLDAGGLQIRTTINGRLQEAAEQAVSSRLAAVEAQPGYPHTAKQAIDTKDLKTAKGAPWLEGAAIALDNATGGIRAIVGGRDYRQSKFHRALHGRRQAGSVVKPFVYASAFEAGLGPGERVSDDAIQPAEIPKGLGAYSPVNSDGGYRGLRPVGEGLVDSRNTMTVRVGLRAGLPRVADTLARAGVVQGVDPYPSMCLGAFETSLKDLTSAFTVFATGGVKLQPYLIEEVLDSSGNVLYRATRGRHAVLQPSAAKATAKLLEEAVANGTAAGARSLGLTGKAAGKTGTTNRYIDAWFVGFDDKLTCGVWVGFDKPRTIMPGGYGGVLALPIWVDIIEAAKRG